MKKMSVFLWAMLIQATVSVFAQVKPVVKDRIRINMSEFIDTSSAPALTRYMKRVMHTTPSNFRRAL